MNTKSRRDQAWFEMQNIRKRNLADSVWIPLRSATTSTVGRFGHVGYESEFVGAGSIAVPLADRAQLDGLSWSEIGLSHNQGSYAFKDSYKPADVYQRRDQIDLGLELVIEQGFGGAESRVWHVHQDLVIALGLMREGDHWVCPSEDYIDVVHLKRNSDGIPVLVEIRAEWLRDYLAARHMALRISMYRSRDTIEEDGDHITWPDLRTSDESEGVKFEARVWPIHEGGDPYGAKTAVFHVWRTDIDHEIDVPLMGNPTDDNTASESWQAAREGHKIYRILGEMWKDEWIEPSAHSPRIRGDKLPSTCHFIVDASGVRQSSDELAGEDIGRWLWFSPNVINAISERRGGSLEWYTGDTGGVGSASGPMVHFGLNPVDLITVYAADIAKLPEWQQRVWAGFNVSPDGGVSKELLASQVNAAPADTMAPEAVLALVLVELDDAVTQRWGKPLLRPHPDTKEIIQKVHRFRATDRSSVLALAKDLARLTADSIDVTPLQAIVPLAKGEKRGSLKSLEKILATVVSPDVAHDLVGPLVGIYDLRVGDAHFASGEIEKAFALAGVDPSLSFLRQGFQVIAATVSCLMAIRRAVPTK